MHVMVSNVTEILTQIKGSTSKVISKQARRGSVGAQDSPLTLFLWISMALSG